MTLLAPKLGYLGWNSVLCGFPNPLQQSKLVHQVTEDLVPSTCFRRRLYRRMIFGIGNQTSIPQDEKGYVPTVQPAIAAGHRCRRQEQNYNVRMKCPHPCLKGQKFLAECIATHSKIKDLDSSIRTQSGLQS